MAMFGLTGSSRGCVEAVEDEGGQPRLHFIADIGDQGL